MNLQLLEQLFKTNVQNLGLLSDNWNSKYM
ncbi:hypothetical protein PAEVO_12820 [Paenibacillus sp. GM2FR]|nr:hypothetical protein PAEVO_12820 [Paenibacillus sp. GM2FR]